WMVSPPSLPVFVRPGSAKRSEHVHAHDPRADIRGHARGVFIIGSRGAVLPAMHSLERPRRDKPVVQFFSADTQRVLHSLVRARAETIVRYRRAAHAKP